MKKHYPLLALCATCLSVGLMHSCKKENVSDGKTTMTEEFTDMNKTLQNGWVSKDNSASFSPLAVATWGQGFSGTDKGGLPYGFEAFSYKSNPDEYAYSYASGLDSTFTISSWLITPVLSIKNGDVLSFYTRGDGSDLAVNRMQVRMNHSTGFSVGSDSVSVGDFTSLLLDINETQTPNGYPIIWKKYEITVTGVPDKMTARFAFRHFLQHAAFESGTALDLFQFQSN